MYLVSFFSEDSDEVTMSIQAFSFPVPETRFFQAGKQVFKFKIRRGEMSRQEHASLFYLFNIKYAVLF